MITISYHFRTDMTTHSRISMSLIIELNCLVKITRNDCIDMQLELKVFTILFPLKINLFPLTKRKKNLVRIHLEQKKKKTKSLNMECWWFSFSTYKIWLDCVSNFYNFLWNTHVFNNKSKTHNRHDFQLSFLEQVADLCGDRGAGGEATFCSVSGSWWCRTTSSCSFSEIQAM